MTSENYFVNAIAQAEAELAKFRALPEDEQNPRHAALALMAYVTDAYTKHLTDIYVENRGLQVRGGPFKGMQYHLQPNAYGTIPALLGSMESELHGFVEYLIGLAPRRIVNVGCGNGYYAVGFARRLPECQVIGVDIEQRCREMTMSLADENGVANRVRVEDLATAASLEAQVGEGTVLFMDCEGAELDLLDPAQTPALKSTVFLVELHDFLLRKNDPGFSLTGTLVGRFKETHNLRFRTTSTPDAFAYPDLMEWGPYQRWVALNEGRPVVMQWMLAIPKNKRLGSP